MDALSGGGDGNQLKEQPQRSQPSSRSASSMARQVAMKEKIQARDALIVRMREAIRGAKISIDGFITGDATQDESLKGYDQQHDQLQELELNACGVGCTTRRVGMEGQIGTLEAQVASMQRSLRAAGLLENDHEHEKGKDASGDEDFKAKSALLGSKLVIEGIGKKRKQESASGLAKKKKLHHGAGKPGKKPTWCRNCKSTHEGQCRDSTISCKRCGKLGHKYEVCISVEPVCFNCWEMGHVRTQCQNSKVPREMGMEKKRRNQCKGTSRKDRVYCKECHSTHKGTCSMVTIRCNRCGLLGHKSVKCLSDRKMCYNCHQLGHISSQCPNPKVPCEVGLMWNGMPKAKGRK